jgi:hypothetical protein
LAEDLLHLLEANLDGADFKCIRDLRLDPLSDLVVVGMVIVAPEPSLGGHSNEQQTKREAKHDCSYHGFLLIEVRMQFFFIAEFWRGLILEPRVSREFVLKSGLSWVPTEMFCQ